MHTVTHTHLNRDCIDLTIRWGDGKRSGVKREWMFCANNEPTLHCAAVSSWRGTADGATTTCPFFAHTTLLMEESVDGKLVPAEQIHTGKLRPLPVANCSSCSAMSYRRPKQALADANFTRYRSSASRIAIK